MAQAFWFESDELEVNLSDVCQLDTMVTVIDALNFLKDFGSADTIASRKMNDEENDERTIVNLLTDQVEFADVILINKTDLISKEELNLLKGMITKLNPQATLIESEFGKVPLRQILDTGRFDYDTTSQSAGWIQELENEHKPQTEVWALKHPSPWDYIFFMNNELGQNLEWSWYYWLWTTESVEDSKQNVKSGKTTVVMVHQAGEMPSPVVLRAEFETGGPAIKSMKNAGMIDENTAIVTWPACVWFNASRTFKARLTFGGRKIAKITLDPGGRFPDKNTADNIWPRE